MRILIVDDEEVLQDVLSTLVESAGHEAITARSGEEALTTLGQTSVDLVLLDLMLPGMSGLEVLGQIQVEHPHLVVIIITAFSSIEGAIDAMRNGAFHYIPKPFKNEEVLLTIEKGLDQRRLASENRQLKAQLKNRTGLDNLIGKSKPMQEIFELIRLAAPSKSNILVLGESGTDKELVAKAIHSHSRRAEKPFVTVNSGSMPGDLLESNLFGHEKGAFTGAIAEKKGLFEVADTGSIFFDEIGNIPMETQAKLLRVVQEREFMRLGGVSTFHADVRFIAATNADLEAGVSQGTFREDLYYRLNVITLKVPPLRERSEDIPLLVNHFLGRYSTENEKIIQGIAPDAMQDLLEYHWPGNVRELENAIERSVVLATTDRISRELLPAPVRSAEPLPMRNEHFAEAGVPFKDAVQSYERRLIIRALKASAGVQKHAAEMLKLKPTTLHEMMKRLKISSESVA